MSNPNEDCQIPCKDCVCLAICRNKSLKTMFDDCKLINNFCGDYVDKSSNRSFATDMMGLSHTINETLDRHFIPCFNNISTVESTDIGLADVNPSVNDISQDYAEKIQNTYRIFKNSFEVDMLEVSRIKPYLLPIVKDFIDD